MITSLLDELVSAALREDLAGGDLTSEAIIPDCASARAVALARSALVVSGGSVFARAFELCDPSLVVRSALADGQEAPPGTLLWEVTGNARAILAAERTALNFVQRLCGIATLARRYAHALPTGSTTRITDTRKTTPLLRALERKAVRDGGAHNHRDALGAAVLIKDNHIAVAGSVRHAIERARAFAPHTSRVEVEVESLDQLAEALSAGADIIMLDNFSDAMVETAVAQTRGRALLEASGGISLDRIAVLARAGIDVISVGALTHSAPAADISLEILAQPNP